MFDLVRLRLLLELARRGTMAAVAEACGLTSSAVSQQLVTLEREARTPLLERVGRRVRLTPEGERLAGHAETILAAVEAAALDLRTVGNESEGVLQVASFATFGKARLLPTILRIRERHPNLRLVVHELEPGESIEAVRDGRCDLAVSFSFNLVPRALPNGLSSEVLFEEPVYLALPLTWADAPDPIDIAALADEEWIVGARQGDDRTLAERLCALRGFAPRMTHAVGEYDLQLGMIAAGLGVGLVPALGFQFSGAANVTIRTPVGPRLTRRIEAVTRKVSAASPRVRTLLSELAATHRA